MKLLYFAMVFLALYGSGCPSPTGPRLHSIYGFIRYPDGHAAIRAKVSTDAGATTFSDALGRYVIVAPVNRDSVTVFARDDYTPGRGYTDVNWGSVRILVRPRPVWQDITLDHAEAI